MKFRLSTLLLLIALVAVALGWYVDHFDRGWRDIVGRWYHPTPDQSLTGYATSLAIRADGTFTKIQLSRESTATFTGKHRVDSEGRIVFHVESKLTEFDIPLLENQREVVDADFSCRCAVDKSGYLIFDNVNGIKNLLENEKLGLHWERSFKRSSRVKQ